MKYFVYVYFIYVLLQENSEENSGDNSIDQTTDDGISQPASTSEQQFTIPNPTNATRKRRLRDLHSLWIK